jgi:hypothetical protein
MWTAVGISGTSSRSIGAAAPRQGPPQEESTTGALFLLDRNVLNRDVL